MKEIIIKNGQISFSEIKKFTESKNISLIEKDGFKKIEISDRNIVISEKENSTKITIDGIEYDVSVGNYHFINDNNKYDILLEEQYNKCVMDKFNYVLNRVNDMLKKYGFKHKIKHSKGTTIGISSQEDICEFDVGIDQRIANPPNLASYFDIDKIVKDLFIDSLIMSTYSVGYSHSDYDGDKIANVIRKLLNKNESCKFLKGDLK